MVFKPNKVEYFGKVLIDLTEDSVTPEKLLIGETAHDKSGNLIKGTLVPLNSVLLNTEIVDGVAVVTLRAVNTEIVDSVAVVSSTDSSDEET